MKVKSKLFKPLFALYGICIILNSCQQNKIELDSRLIGTYKELSFAGDKIMGEINIKKNGEFTYKDFDNSECSCSGQFIFGSLEYFKSPFNKQFSQNILSCDFTDKPAENYCTMNWVKWGVGCSIGYSQRDALGPTAIPNMYLWVENAVVEQAVLFTSNNFEKKTNEIEDIEALARAAAADTIPNKIIQMQSDNYDSIENTTKEEYQLDSL